MFISLAGRLLCAADQAYKVCRDGPVTDDPPWSEAAGYAAPTGFIAGPDKIDAALLGDAADGVTLAFRGTLPPESPSPAQVVRDWVNDADARLVPAPGSEGLVHRGFLTSLDRLWPKILPALQSAMARSGTKPLYVTGHSKGGAVANLAAIRCAAVFPGRKVIVSTFGAARPGDRDFAAFYDVKIPNSTRYENVDDIVPHLTPEDAFVPMFQRIPFMAGLLPGLNRGYASVGELHFIDWSGRIVDESPGLQFARFKSLAELMLCFGFQKIIDDHGLENGYARAVCPVLVPGASGMVARAA